MQIRAAFVRETFIKIYTDLAARFMPEQSEGRNHVAKMKMVPVHDLIERETALVDDSIVRGTQLGKRFAFYENGAKEVHMRSPARRS